MTPNNDDYQAQLNHLRDARASLRSPAQICIKAVAIGAAGVFSTALITQDTPKSVLIGCLASGASLMHDGTLQAKRNKGDYD